jgi:hypothetical protein
MERLRLTQGQHEEGEEAAQENQAEPWARTISYNGEDEGAEGGWSHDNWVEQALQVAHGKAKKGKGKKSASVHPTEEVRLNRIDESRGRLRSLKQSSCRPAWHLTG